ncbi:MAG: Dam family site-specific DNA-(adenine-N6)-methyltransferase [Sandaracinaceae bacterium]|nr:Dam family site-specific DNA-(adenine-N6)-methyltransferase [Sandaracinaceae bacterium]
MRRPPARRGGARGPGRPAASFVKWVGSKQGVLSAILARMAPPTGRYFEPMVGSGVVFLGLAPERAVLGDANAELVDCYRVIRDDVEALVRALDRHVNTREHFLAVRAQRPEDLPPVERAARFIFLNKTCFNGLYRVNAAGAFNVPYGGIAHANFRDAATLRRVSARLEGVSLRCADVAECVRDAGPGDLVYLDPPYFAAPRAEVRYRAQGFGVEGHERLAALFDDLDRRGCRVVLSNADAPEVRALYRGRVVEVLATRRPVNRDARARDGWRELLIRNYDDPPRSSPPAAPLAVATPSASAAQALDALVERFVEDLRGLAAELARQSIAKVAQTRRDDS